MRADAHATVAVMSLAGGTMVSMVTCQPAIVPVVLAFALVMVFIDLDHLVDYWYGRPRRWWHPGAFLDACYGKLNPKFICPLHSWELVILSGLALLAGWEYVPAWTFGAWVGYLCHMIMDQTGNDGSSSSSSADLKYWLCWRGLWNFNWTGGYWW